MTRNDRWIRWLFLLLLPALFLQLKLRPITEPYPAVLLPAGASVLRSGGGSYTTYETECLVEDARGELVPLDRDAVLRGVQESHRGFVIARGLGLAEGRDVRRQAITLAGRTLQLEFGQELTAAQLARTREWLRAEIRASMDIDARRVHILHYAITTSRQGDVERQQRRLEQRLTVDLTESGT